VVVSRGKIFQSRIARPNGFYAAPSSDLNRCDFEESNLEHGTFFKKPIYSSEQQVVFEINPTQALRRRKHRLDVPVDPSSFREGGGGLENATASWTCRKKKSNIDFEFHALSMMTIHA
jgi:hypothetical protein